ncbi:MAG: T9SS type A sorting domain-containing protein [Ignavibacteria bacterium]|jgi:hypothetical protein|nr:T9SS type A sorting domain-containing protein [Ignavibacteria bacterium]
MKRILSYVFLLLAIVVAGASVNLYAGFATITSSAGPHGTISPLGTQSVVEGADFTFNFLPDLGFEVDEVTVDGSPEVVTVPYYTFKGSTLKAGENYTIHVTFKVKTFHIIASCDANAFINPEGDDEYNFGDEAVYNFGANAGYQIKAVLVDGNVQTAGINSYTFSNINANHTIEVTTELVPVKDSFNITITFTPADGSLGTTNPAGVIKMEIGENLPVFYTPGVPVSGSPYEVASVTVDGAAVPFGVYGGEYDGFINIQANHTMHVVFINPDGINDVTIPELNIFPNPTTGKATIEAGDNIINSVEIINMVGNVVMTINNPSAIDISNLENGLYFVRFYTNNGTTTRQIVKK